MVTTPNIPAVSEHAAIDDAAWFDTHPQRRFRSRIDEHGQLWLIRRRPQGHSPDIFLRTPAPSDAPALPDDDLAIGRAWYAIAFGLAPDAAAAAARKALRRAAGKREGAA